MSVQIGQKIVGYEVVKGEAETAAKSVDTVVTGGDAEENLPHSNVIQMHESLERPDHLVGSTYKIKTPLSEHALYVTVNDIVLNEDTEHEQRRPFEIFINSKNMDHFQWIVALTRIISAIFRKGGDVTFLVEELRSVFDPRGGYFKRGGKYMPSLVAEIGDCIECHLKSIGMLGGDCVDENQRKYLKDKQREIEQAQAAAQSEPEPEPESSGLSETQGNFPPGAQLCTKCMTRAAVKLDGCMTCLNCGKSKCG